MESGWGTVKCSDNLWSGISVEDTIVRAVSRSLSQILVHNITRCGDRLTFSLRFFSWRKVWNPFQSFYLRHMLIKLFLCCFFKTVSTAKSCYFTVSTGGSCYFNCFYQGQLF